MRKVEKVDDVETYSVDEILDSRSITNTKYEEYKVRWLGYDEEADQTWETQARIGALNDIMQFWEQKAEHAKTKKTKDSAKAKLLLFKRLCEVTPPNVRFSLHHPTYGSDNAKEIIKKLSGFASAEQVLCETNPYDVELQVERVNEEITRQRYGEFLRLARAKKNDPDLLHLFKLQVGIDSLHMEALKRFPTFSMKANGICFDIQAKMGPHYQNKREVKYQQSSATTTFELSDEHLSADENPVPSTSLPASCRDGIALFLCRTIDTDLVQWDLRVQKQLPGMVTDIPKNTLICRIGGEIVPKEEAATAFRELGELARKAFVALPPKISKTETISRINYRDPSFFMAHSCTPNCCVKWVQREKNDKLFDTFGWIGEVRTRNKVSAGDSLTLNWYNGARPNKCGFKEYQKALDSLIDSAICLEPKGKEICCKLLTRYGPKDPKIFTGAIIG
ncbi:unnamed protein product, partial [Mesorhabditis belari]|uniref:Chromo domain-containing protein n=1 Tax=Mesorhabditis belari TaxID=2138241 RepID=A0AAF3FHQ2_9BILA